MGVRGNREPELQLSDQQQRRRERPVAPPPPLSRHRVPTLAAGITFLDGYTCARLPANLLQAQRDFFGAHTYERVDQPRGQFFHTHWLP